MKKFILLFLFLISTSLSSQDIFGSWAFLQYYDDSRSNLLDVINIIKVDESKAIVQHSFYLKKEKNYILNAKIEDGKICYIDPITGWNITIELTSSNLLTMHPDFDEEFVKQYRRPDVRFYEFLANIDDFVNKSQHLQK
jgi:hypothetical protein